MGSICFNPPYRLPIPAAITTRVGFTLMLFPVLENELYIFPQGLEKPARPASKAWKNGSNVTQAARGQKQNLACHAAGKT
jgi:hypothetical protein